MSYYGSAYFVGGTSSVAYRRHLPLEGKASCQQNLKLQTPKETRHEPTVKKYAEQCGINDISPHQLRHTKAMHLTEANVNPIFIRDFLGHTDLKVTEIYSKTSVKMKREALKKMDTKEVIPADAKEWNEDAELMTWLKSL